MKKILIIHSNMMLGGAESSLLGLLQSLDYSKFSVELMLLEKKGELLSFIPNDVKVLKTPKEYECLVLPIKDVFFKRYNFAIGIARLLGKILGRVGASQTYVIKQCVHRLALPFLPKIKGNYDLAISFIDPHYIVTRKVDAKITLGWLHTDFSRVQVYKKQDIKMWNGLDYIVHISDSCKEKFDKKYPMLKSKSIVIENILSKTFLKDQAEKKNISKEMVKDGKIRLLSIGRFCYPKNFDSVPMLCKIIRKSGLDIKWYIIGYGGDEELIRQKIHETGMEDFVIILGKKDNPYPYIKECDVYVQPSRYEGKCVAVREAQIFEKPVIITNYATSKSQLIDGIDGMIVPMEINACAKAMTSILKNKKLQRKISDNCKNYDYTNSKEIKKIYQMVDE